MSDKLEDARKIINEVDAQMAELFIKRMRAVESVFEYKKEFGLPILDQKREDAVIEKASSLVEDEVLKEYYIDYMKHMMSVSRAYQYRMQSGLKVAYSGVEGAFAHIAAGRIFPEGRYISCCDFKAAYDSVVNGESDVAVLPIENSYAGEVGQTIDLIFSGSLYVNGIYELEIHQNLLGLPNATVDDIKKVTSHPQALGQCHEYIKMRGLETEEANNTALAAKAVAEANDKSLGAIASVETARLYGLKIIEANINKSGENTTRFAVLSKVRAKTPSFSSTVLMFSVKHEAGSLANAIGIIGRYGYSMTALRSRPMKKHSWQYYFYVEIDGFLDNENGEGMIKELSKVCDKLKVAGAFEPHTEI
ncbi:MAG: chorismate mutase [Clostridia bacterium]|nr:chorismate mutase [Clostridia bacterium]